MDSLVKCEKTHEMFGVHRDYAIKKESTTSRAKRDNADEEMVHSTLNGSTYLQKVIIMFCKGFFQRI